MMKHPDAGCPVLDGSTVGAAQQDYSRQSMANGRLPDPPISMSLPSPPNPSGLARMGTARIRNCFLLDHLFEPHRLILRHSEIDRATAGGAVPGSGPLELLAPSEFGSEYFTQRRELGVFNIGGPGVVGGSQGLRVGDTGRHLYRTRQQERAL